MQPAAVPAPAKQAAPEEGPNPEPTLIASQPEQTTIPTATSSSVLNEVLPSVPEKIQSRIQGRIYVTVRALVDPAGNVIGVLTEDPGPSKYFARISDQAARQWQFAPADQDDARVWLLRFEYTRNGVAVKTSEQ